MQFADRRLLLLVLLVPTATAAAQTPPMPVSAVVESSLTSAAGHIRQFVFDGEPLSYFASTENARKSDYLTLRFDRPVTLRSIAVTTGRPDGTDALESGALEVSADGKDFTTAAIFAGGSAHAALKDRPVRALRVRPAADLTHPLVIREVAVGSDPLVTIFKYPIEVSVDIADAPELKEWADRCARLCERHYPMICAELASPGFTPRTSIRMTLKKDYKGVAEASGGRITGSVAWFKGHPQDMGAMIHETVHCVQDYRTRGNPGWLVEGIADYIRFFKYEPGQLGKLNVERARYDGSYRVTAAFLAYVSEQHDKQLVRRLNQALREGEYREEIWRVLTKKTLKELDNDWRASLRAPAQTSAAGPRAIMSGKRYAATNRAREIASRRSAITFARPLELVAIDCGGGWYWPPERSEK